MVRTRGFLAHRKMLVLPYAILFLFGVIGVRCGRFGGRGFEKVEDGVKDREQIAIRRSEECADTEISEDGVVLLGEDTAHHHGDGVGGTCIAKSLHDLLGDLEVGAAKNGKPDDIGAFFDGGLYDIVGGKADPRVDHIEAKMTCGDGDDLGSVGMSVQTGFSDKHTRSMPKALAEGLDTVLERASAVFLEREGLAFDAGSCAVFTKDTTQSIGPFSCRHASEGALDRGGHHILSAASGFLEGVKGRLDFFWTALLARLIEKGKRFVGGEGIDAKQAAVLVGYQGRGQAFGPTIDADDDLFAALDAADARRHRAHKSAFHVAALDRSVDTPHAKDMCDLFAGFGFDRVRFGLDHRASIEDVGVFEKIGFVSKDLLQA